jgi:hypothetical protein
MTLVMPSFYFNRHDITEILLKVALNTITVTPFVLFYTVSFSVILASFLRVQVVFAMLFGSFGLLDLRGFKLFGFAIF